MWGLDWGLFREKVNGKIEIIQQHRAADCFPQAAPVLSPSQSTAFS